MDASFLGSMDLPPDANDDDHEEVTGDRPLPAAAPPRPARPAAPPARPAARTAAPARTASARPAAKPAAKPAPRRMPEPEPEPEAPAEEDWRPKRTAAAAPPPKKERDAAFTTPNEALDEAREFVGTLTLSDKLTAGGVGLLFLSLFIPWRETAADGDELGIVTSGFLAGLLGLGALGALFVRLRKLVPGLSPLAPWVGQVAMAGLSVVVCLVFLKTSVDTTPVPTSVGNSTMWASKPSIGAIIGLAGAAVSLVGTLVGFKEKQP